MIGHYWLELEAWRKMRRDRWLTLGAAMIAPFQKILTDRNVEVRLVPGPTPSL
ncbi:hypothetical protein WG907_17390 [Sphingobium sp. AN558]|uniref:hypothetical protein n=1 Tax=Sphingobium sp. AN558 TaxID=3133442 RepID=UPI0030BC74A7